MRRLLAVAGLAGVLATPAALAQGGADYTVFFRFDSAELSTEARATVARAAEDFRATGSADIRVRGHTDTAGAGDYNLDLSRQRAEAVARALIADGVPAGAISANGVGQSDLAIQTADGVREQANRRVTIDLTRPEPAAAPPPAPAPEPWGINYAVGGYFGWALSTSDRNSDAAYMPGLNLAVGYEPWDFLEIEAEQAVFWTFADPDDGFGARTVIGLNLQSRYDNAVAYVGGNFGGIYTVDTSYGSTWIAGPELGVRWDRWHAKLAYDIPLDRDWDDGVISATLALQFRV
jgi:hypothetical protein